VRQRGREFKLIMHFVVDVKCIFYPRAVLIIPELVYSGSNVSFNKRKKKEALSVIIKPLYNIRCVPSSVLQRVKNSYKLIYNYMYI
jgi:hypothetical protein